MVLLRYGLKIPLKLQLLEISHFKAKEYSWVIIVKFSSLNFHKMAKFWLQVIAKGLSRFGILQKVSESRN